MMKLTVKESIELVKNIGINHSKGMKTYENPSEVFLSGTRLAKLSIIACLEELPMDKVIGGDKPFPCSLCELIAEVSRNFQVEAESEDFRSGLSHQLGNTLLEVTSLTFSYSKYI